MERYSYYRNTESGAMYKIDNHREDSISMMLNMAYEPLVNATADEYGKYVANNYKSPATILTRSIGKQTSGRYEKIEEEDIVVCPYCSRKENCILMNLSMIQSLKMRNTVKNVDKHTK